MPKRILVLNGHPDPESYNVALTEAYVRRAAAAEAEVRVIHIRKLDFNPNLQCGYRKRTELEPDLLAAWEDIQWCQHLAVVHPVWWGSLPAIFKGFIDRLFLPGFVFEKREGSLMWDPLLKGRSGRIITTMDQPGLWYRLRYGQPSIRAMKAATMRFVGIWPVRTLVIGPIRLSKDAFRAKALQKAEAAGQRDAR
jgi:putative NADPH-quinone reductase